MAAHKYCAWCGYRFGDTDFTCANCQAERGFCDPDSLRPPRCDSDAHRNLSSADALKDGEVQWQKVLWRHQQFDDNYVDKQTFLNSLVTNANVQPFHYGSMVSGSLPVIRGISVVAVFGLVFTLCWAGQLSSQVLLGMDVALFVLAKMLLGIYCQADTTPFDVRQTAILLTALGGVTPVLHTLTREWHDDTILALSIICLGAHLLTGEYSMGAQPLQSGTGVTSLNAALFASVMLASRLHSNELVFAFLLYAIEVFALLPMFCCELDEHLPGWASRLSVMLAALATGSIFPLSRFVSLGHMLTVLCGAFVCPLWLMYVQQYKVLIQGQWDEAVPDVTR